MGDASADRHACPAFQTTVWDLCPCRLPRDTGAGTGWAGTFLRAGANPERVRYPALPRRLSVRNCPQAARISCPRGVRIGAANPAAITIAANRSRAALPLGSYFDPGHGLNGIRFTFAGIPAISRTSSRASASESLIPFNMIYSKVIRRAFEDPGYRRQAASTSAIGYFRFRGTISSRN